MAIGRVAAQAPMGGAQPAAIDAPPEGTGPHVDVATSRIDARQSTPDGTRRRPRTTAPAKSAVGAPASVDGLPRVKATPSRAGVGARVRLEGTGFIDDHWSEANAPLWLASVSGCGLYAEAEHTLRVTPDGRLRGDIIIPARGACRQSERGDQPVVTGRYRIALSCTACIIGELEVTTPAPAGARCRDVAFSRNSDDLASSIMAWNTACSEAEALVRKVGPPLGFTGPATAGADGYRCVRTGRDDRELPQALYECGNGSKRVTFTRT